MRVPWWRRYGARFPISKDPGRGSAIAAPRAFTSTTPRPPAPPWRCTGTCRPGHRRRTPRHPPAPRRRARAGNTRGSSAPAGRPVPEHENLPARREQRVVEFGPRHRGVVLPRSDVERPRQEVLRRGGGWPGPFGIDVPLYAERAAGPTATSPARPMRAVAAEAQARACVRATDATVPAPLRRGRHRCTVVIVSWVSPTTGLLPRRCEHRSGVAAEAWRQRRPCSCPARRARSTAIACGVPGGLAGAQEGRGTQAQDLA